MFIDNEQEVIVNIKKEIVEEIKKSLKENFPKLKINFSYIRNKNFNRNDKFEDGKISLEIGNKRVIKNYQIKKIITQATINNLLDKRDIFTNLSDTYSTYIVLTDYLSRNVSLELKNENINFIDTSGNIFLTDKDIYIYYYDKSKKKIVPEKDELVNRKNIELLFYFLNDRKILKKTYREISDITGVSLGKISNTFKILKNKNFLVKKNNKHKLIRTEELLDRWIENYNNILKDKIYINTYRTKLNEINQELIINKNLKNTYISSEYGINLISNKIRSKNLYLYTQEKLDNLIKSLKLIPDSNGNIKLFSLFWNDEYIFNPDYDCLVPYLLLYADLLEEDIQRNKEVIKELYEKHIQPGVLQTSFE
ncbi:MAG: hypothetical protein FXF47_06530 [Candidatus Mcinerneyibacterium aminivorans]|uniref:Uncharacterized protein n=1 Tax=Candidatus Mcinerneyibacterium aminivorans TaxID=2703815 RepID=A0A5D0MKA1_9BACT|nr:MAG: hypothetical protein FXF47_06530 [Candidatus Mcinerneyibacterium aminivorans]